MKSNTIFALLLVSLLFPVGCANTGSLTKPSPEQHLLLQVALVEAAEQNPKAKRALLAVLRGLTTEATLADQAAAWREEYPEHAASLALLSNYLAKHVPAAWREVAADLIVLLEALNDK